MIVRLVGTGVKLLRGEVERKIYKYNFSSRCVAAFQEVILLGIDTLHANSVCILCTT